MPSIVNGLFAGRAGIASHGTAIAVLADNIANANTVAFKTSRAEFTDLLAGNLTGGGGVNVGSGSSVSAVTQNFSQGTFEFTGRGLDLAIDGQGFFIVEGEAGRFYSRAGNLKIDADGNLLNQNGLAVLGFPGNGAGGLQQLNVSSLESANVSTRNVTISANLDASAPLTAVPVGAPTFEQLNEAASFSTYVDVYDSLGAAHTITVYFFHTASGTWQARAYADGSEVGGATPGEAVLLNNGTATLSFDDAGTRLAVPTPPAADFDNAGPPTGAPYTGWSNGASDTTTIDFIFDPTTQFSSSSTVSAITQDGKGLGNVLSVSVQLDGTLFALLDNGQTSTIGIIALATFANPEGLRRNGESLYSKSTESGEAVIGKPGVGEFGSIQSGALELSTSDLAADFIKLISLQRGFQGSSRVITSIDDLLNEIINLAR